MPIDKLPFDEDMNVAGLYWSFVVQRSDIATSGTAIPIINKCPFVKTIKKYVETLLSDAINICIDEMNLHKCETIESIVNKIYTKYARENLVPQIKNIKVMGDSDGMRIIVYLGEGYANGILWTDYHEYITEVQAKYVTSGVTKLREEIKNAVSS